MDEMQVEVSFRKLVIVVLLGRAVAGSLLAACFGNMQKNRFGSSGCNFYVLYKLYGVS